MELLRNQKMDNVVKLDKDDAEEKTTSDATSTGGEKCPHLWSKRWLAVKNVDHAQLGLIQARYLVITPPRPPAGGTPTLTPTVALTPTPTPTLTLPLNLLAGG